MKKRTYRANPRAVKLAKDLQAQIYWLRDIPHQRITTSLYRFAVTGWTAHDIHTALDQLLTARGWRVPDGRTTPGRTPYQLHSPWGYLAALLRGIDPADRAIEVAYAQEQAHAAYQLTLITGPPCTHGQPGGDTPSPVRGTLACPLCRATSRSTA